MSRESILALLRRNPRPALLLDLDGTLLRGGRATDGAAELLRARARSCAIVSNNSTHTPESLADELAARGLDADPSKLALAGAVAVDRLAERRPAARTMLLGSAGLARRAVARGLSLRDEDPDVVLLARDTRATYVSLAAAANAVRAGAELVVANPDLWHPGAGAARVPETGALLAALLACAGDVAYTVIGKPSPILFERGLAILGAAAHEALVVGDNPDTDLAGARALDIECAIVGDSPQADWPDLRAFLADTGLAQPAGKAVSALS